MPDTAKMYHIEHNELCSILCAQIIIVCCEQPIKNYIILYYYVLLYTLLKMFIPILKIFLFSFFFFSPLENDSLF